MPIIPSDYLKEKRGLIITEGVLFTILGIVAVILPTISTLAIELFLGWIMLFSGCIQLFRTFSDKAHISFWGSLLTSTLYVVAGILLIIYPLTGIVSLTLLLMFFFILEGLSKIVLGFSIRPWSNSIWFILNGIIALIMAYIIYAGWPGTALWVLGLLVGINMIFFGMALIFFGNAIPKSIS